MFLSQTKIKTWDAVSYSVQGNKLNKKSTKTSGFKMVQESRTSLGVMSKLTSGTLYEGKQNM